MSTFTAADDAATFTTEVLQSDVPVVVDFWAAWCGPCRMVTPELEKLAAAHGSAVKVVKVDVDANPEVAGRYRIQGIPTIALFRNGEVVASSVGAKPVRGHRGRPRTHGRLTQPEPEEEPWATSMKSADELRQPTRDLRKAIPDTWAGFGELHRSAMADGALPSRVKELMALVVGVVEHCDGCVAYHARAAAAAGATEAEVGEALGVALLMNGGPASVWAPRAFAA